MKYLLNVAFAVATVWFVAGQFLDIGDEGQTWTLVAALVFGAVAFTGGIVASSRALTGFDTGIAPGVLTPERAEVHE